MANIQRFRVTWAGLTGLPGVSTFYVADGATAMAPIRAYFDALKAFVASGVVWSFPSGGDILEETTGALTGAWAATPAANVNATGVGVFSAPSGFSVKWLTTSIVNGHRVTGRTYFVPAARDAYDALGTLNDTIIAPINAAGATMIASMPTNLLVWSRPREAFPAWTDKFGNSHPAVTAASGLAVIATSSAVSDKAAVLTSRRD